MIEISKRLVLINSSSAVMARLVNGGILFWMHQHLVRRLSAEEYSLYPVVMGLTVFAPLLSTILTGGLARFVVEAYSNDDRSGVTEIVSTLFPLLLGAGILVLAGGGLFSWHIDTFVRLAPERLSDARILMALMIVLVAVGLPLAPFQLGLYVKQKFVWINLLQMGTQLFRAAILVSLLFGVSTRIIWVPVATVVAELSKQLLMLVISRRLIPALRFRLASIRWPTARKLLTFGLWTFVAQLADTLRTGLSPIILKNLAGAFDVVCFSVGWMFFYQIQLASYIVTAPVQPAITAMHVMGNRDGLRRAYLCGGRYALWAAMLVVTPLIIFRDSLISLYVGAEYLVAGSVMALLLLQFPIAYANIMLPKIAHAMDRMRPLALWSIAIQIGTVLLTLYLVVEWKMGAMGAAVSNLVIALIAWPLVLGPLGMRMVDVRLRTVIRETMVPSLVPTIAGGAVWYALALTVPVMSWAGLALCMLSGSVVYCIVLLAFCLNPQERRDLVLVGTRIRSFVRCTRSKSPSAEDVP